MEDAGAPAPALVSSTRFRKAPREAEEVSGRPTGAEAPQQGRLDGSTALTTGAGGTGGWR